MTSKTCYCQQQQQSSQYPIFPSQARDQSFTRVVRNETEYGEDIEGWVQITLIVSCLEWFTFVFLFCLFIMVEGAIRPRLTKGTHFSCYESLPKGPGGVLDISLGGEVRRGPSYPDPV